MRGKKSDTEFLSKFIRICVAENKVSPEQIRQEAQHQIDNIDCKIREVEKLKLNRSKLTDVINTFDENKKTISPLAKSLSLFNIKNGDICKFICDLLKEKNVKLEDICNNNFNTHDTLFCIKQLIEFKVVYKTGDYLLQGSRFNEYIRVVLQDK